MNSQMPFRPITRSAADHPLPAGRGVGGEGEEPTVPHLRRQRGFTLIELWVSILIVGTIAGITLAAFQRGTQTAKLRSARDEMLDDLRTMHSYSVSGRPVVDANGVECPTTTTKCGGYGMYLVEGEATYKLYQDFDGDSKFDNNQNELIPPVKTLPANINIEMITYLNCGTSYGGGSCFTGTPSDPNVSNVHVYFAPYFGSTTFTGFTSAGNLHSKGQQVTIRLRDTASNRTLDFTVDKLAGGIRE